MVMSLEDVKSVFDEAIKNCYDNGYAADIEDMTSDELTAELIDGNDCFEEDDRETLREVVRSWQEQRAGFNVGNRTSSVTMYDEVNRPQSCLYKGGAGVELGSGIIGCPICSAEIGVACRQSEQDKERERVWNERRGTGLNVGIVKP